MTSTNLLTGEVSWRTKCQFSVATKPSELGWNHDGNIVTMAKDQEHSQGGLIHDLQNRIRVPLTEANCRLIGDITFLQGFQRIFLRRTLLSTLMETTEILCSRKGFMLHKSYSIFIMITNDNMVTVHCCPSATCSCPDLTKQIAAAPATWSQCKQGSNHFQLFASTLCVRNQSCLAHPSKSPSSPSVFLLTECKKHHFCIQTRKRNQSLEHSQDSHKESR